MDRPLAEASAFLYQHAGTLSSMLLFKESHVSSWKEPVVSGSKVSSLVCRDSLRSPVRLKISVGTDFKLLECK